jgi:hypothetical protein
MPAKAGATTPGATTPGQPRRDPKGQTGISPYMEQIKKGEDAFVARDFTGAVAAFQEAIKLDVQKMLGYYRIGEAQLAAGNVAEAEAQWQSALTKTGSDDLRAKVYFVPRGPPRAAAEVGRGEGGLDRVLELPPGEPEGARLRRDGRRAHQAGRPPREGREGLRRGQGAHQEAPGRAAQGSRGRTPRRTRRTAERLASARWEAPSAFALRPSQSARDRFTPASGRDQPAPDPASVHV